ncbi:unnamed protein product [Arabidopsis lyrata]|uniref:Predicted protein n=1 Tax=Arabidopsis lyrata subsp. lyrata TaxID=81972 RepID=D7LMX2_ARALL|nr:predicted protein [Arabidopsis lyrata subsp. lyrata]CAH8267610.1 unnamed protein product [Arabidopsis lyrata]
MQSKHQPEKSISYQAKPGITCTTDSTEATKTASRPICPVLGFHMTSEQAFSTISFHVVPALDCS